MQKRLLAFAVALAMVFAPLTGLARAEQQAESWTIPEGYELKYELLDVFPVSMVALLNVWLEDADGNRLPNADYPAKEEFLLRAQGGFTTYDLVEDENGHKVAQLLLMDFVYDEEYVVILADWSGNEIRADEPFVFATPEGLPYAELEERGFALAPDADGNFIVTITGQLFRGQGSPFTAADYEAVDVSSYTGEVIDFVADDEGFTITFITAEEGMHVLYFIDCDEGETLTSQKIDVFALDPEPQEPIDPEEPVEEPEDPEEEPTDPAPIKKLTFTVGQAGYSANGQQREMVAAFKKGDHTMVPVRMLQDLGANFVWHQATRTATFTLGEKVVKITQDSTQAFVDGETAEMPVAPLNVEGRLMIPVRFISENLGLFVHWRVGDIITISLLDQ